MRKLKIGVFGAGRGTSMIKYCRSAENAELVAICDKWQDALDTQRERLGDGVAYYTDFDEFILHDMDAVVLSNYASEHAPFAVRCLEAGKHVFSEVVAAANMKQAVELVEAVERCGKVYAYGENYCYMRAPYEMRRLYRQGRIGELEYAEGEYIHNCESIWPSITYGDPNHWRNNSSAFFYCSHSIGPIVHITGLRPVSVIGIESRMMERNLRMGAKKGQFGIEMLTMENGAIVKSIHGGLYRNSVWYTMYGAKGRMETARKDAENGLHARIYVNADEYSGGYDTGTLETYEPRDKFFDKSEAFGHGGADFYSMYHFVEKALGNPDADIIDVYEAMDMTLPGMFAYRSAMAGSVPMEIPDLRKKEERDRWRNDTTCTFKSAAGEMYVPPCTGGEVEIPDAVYQHVRDLWDKKPRRR